jgi:methionine-gamma-lyase
MAPQPDNPPDDPPGEPPADLATMAIHHGWAPQGPGGLTPPLHLSTAYGFDSAAEADAMLGGGRPGFYYTRSRNPTCALLEDRMAALEGAAAAVATASGVGALAAVFWSLCAPGDRIVVHRTIYGDTDNLLHDGLARFGVAIDTVDLTDPAALDAVLTPATRLVHLETPANPSMDIIDIAAVAERAHAAGARVVVDSTFNTPMLTRPLAHGADIVVHSATKYLGGHGDLVGGLALGDAETMAVVRKRGMKVLTGAPMAPFNAMLVLRGLQTLDLRMERHCHNASAVARFLADHPAVARVAWPGLPDHPGHALARRQMAGYGGMIAFDLAGGRTAAPALLDGVRLIARALSLGEAGTLIQHPATMSHAGQSADRLAAQGLGAGTIRLSVGLEAVDDILADLARGLDAAQRAAAA